jgi:2-dehydropantoate 2-reductase
VQDREADVLWRKLALLAPAALATSSARGPVGAVRSDEELRELMMAAAREVAEVARTQGATLDADQAVQAMSAFPDAMRTSMERDVAAGSVPELDAIGGPIVRIGAEQGVPTPATAELVRRVRELYDRG